MKNLHKDFKLLSAYIDDELTPGEKSEIEEKLLTSPELQKKLKELKKIKELTTYSYKKVEENPYFETRVGAALSFDNQRKNKVKKWYPAIGFTIVTIALMIVLKFNPTLIEDIVKQQKTNLSGFYTENLKPLLLTAGLTNEDIFNFALSKQLPLDKSSNKFLVLGSKANGDDYFEIKNASIIPDVNSFDKFVHALKLNSEQKHQMDSILDSYADDLQSQVLVNDKNTVAINPNLWNYHKAIFADIMAFAKDANRSEFNKIIPTGYTFYDKPEVDKFVRNIKNRPDSQYIFITPDSVFSSTFKFDKDKFRAEMEKFHKELKENLKEFDKNAKGFRFNIMIDSNLAKLKHDTSFNKNFKIFVDSNMCRIELGNIHIPHFELPDFDSIAAQIDKATSNIRNFAFSIPQFDGKNHFKFKFREGDSTHSFDFKIPNIDSLIGLHKNFFYSPGDSTAALRFFRNDSLINQKEFRKQMQKLQKEIEKMREEMKNLKNDLRKETKKSKSVEI
ncbi:MAG: zf-HC2 domain-containing protein [Ignavibacteriaceae bacterium]|jgi:hypothetical protein